MTNITAMPVRKRPRKAWVRDCDAAWSRYVRRIGYCERCERSEGVLHAHHIVGRRNRRVRWEPRNGVSICYRCHRWAHEEPLEFADWIRAHRPEDVSYLASIKNEIANHSDHDLAAIRDELQGALVAA